MNAMWIGRIGAVAALVGLTVGAPAVLAGAGHPEAVAGKWGGPVPCVPISDPTSSTTTCIGSTTWVGGLTGQTHYVFTGTIDLVTGAGRGQIDETFVGRDADGRFGTLRLTETIVSEPSGLPATGSVVIDARIVNGTGNFAGARGEIVFRGTVNVVAGDLGTYAGTVKTRRG